MAPSCEEGQSVTHVSGILCYLSLRKDSSRVGRRPPGSLRLLRLRLTQTESCRARHPPPLAVNPGELRRDGAGVLVPRRSDASREGGPGAPILRSRQIARELRLVSHPSAPKLRRRASRATVSTCLSCLEEGRRRLRPRVGCSSASGRTALGNSSPLGGYSRVILRRPGDVSVLSSFVHLG
jgi:hypothetical protein